MNGGQKVVCVTGASGFIASWLVKLLLQHGYTVKATVRDPNDPKKTGHLLSLDGAKERLNLFKAELLDEGCFDSIVDGCDGVFHTASPVFFASSDDRPTELIDSAVKGTLNVLKSCAKAPSVKRVVMTSSITAVNGKPISPDMVIDETWFSDANFFENSKSWYKLSKTLAEEAAWKFSKENGIDLVTLNPAIVIGPILQPTLNATVEPVLDIMNGRKLLPIFNRFVDVRDVAFAHIQAFEIPSANGRYCMIESTTDVYEVLNILNELYPALHLIDKFEAKPIEKLYQVSSEKIKGLGVHYIPLKASLKDTVESLKEKGFLRI